MMRRKAEEEEIPSRGTHRYYIALPMQVEIPSGIFGKKRVPARPVDLSAGGAACHVRPNKAFKVGKRYRLFIDGVPGFVEVRNIQPVEDGLWRVGMSFVKLELDTQERIVDALDDAKIQTSKLNIERD